MNQRRRQKLKAQKTPQFTDVQIWNLDRTLARYIASGLRQFLAQNLHGTPCDFSNSSHRLDGENSEEMHEWRRLLEKMRWSFEEVAGDFEEKSLGDTEYRAKVQEGIDLFAKYFLDLWD